MSDLLRLNSRLINFSAFWRLDGDLMRCRKCGRSIIASRQGEAMVHEDGCEAGLMKYPWHQLFEILKNEDKQGGEE